MRSNEQAAFLGPSAFGSLIRNGPETEPSCLMISACPGGISYGRGNTGSTDSTAECEDADPPAHMGLPAVAGCNSKNQKCWEVGDEANTFTSDEAKLNAV